MHNFDGQILFALITSLFLAWLTSWLVGKRYAIKVLALMQMGTAPSDEAPANPDLIAASLATNPVTINTDNLLQQNRFAYQRLRLALVLMCLILAAIIAYVAQAAYVEEAFSLRRWLTLSMVYAWPCVPTIGLLERWSRGRIFFISLCYILLSSALVMFNSNENQSFLPVLIWLLSEQLPLLLIIFFMTGPKLRSTGPYLILLFFMLCVSSLLGLNALEYALAEGVESWVVDLALLSNAYVVFALFSIVPWLLAFFPVRYLARRIATAYQHKAFSEPLYLTAGLWIITLLIQAMIISHSIGWTAYNLVFASLFVPLFTLLTRRSLQPRHQPPTLLLLRVFRGDNSIETLFDQVIERWRYSGNTLLIAGKDLALRNLAPDALFGFLSGRLQDRFITDQQRLQETLNKLDLTADPDGRFRVNELFCFDDTWKMVLETLINQADRVLMDLRGYTPDRQGCGHELTVLAAKPHLKKVLILFDKHTDKTSAEWLLADSVLKVDWIDSEQQTRQTTQQLLQALLT